VHYTQSVGGELLLLHVVEGAPRRWLRRSVTDQVRRRAPAAVLTVGPHRRCLKGTGDLDALFPALGLGQAA
jgi:hypothetical protein